VQADVRDLTLAGQATLFALARWEGPGVLLGTTCPLRGEVVIAGATSFRAPATDLWAVQPRTRLAGGLWISPPSMMLICGGGHVTSFWWAHWVFAMTVMPAATDFAHRSGL
jgi:hypothetical protein